MEDKLNTEKVSPISAENIVIMTELAQIGLNHLKMLMPDMREVAGKPGASLTAEHLSHFESILSEGPDTIVHFSNMCQYITDTAKELHDLKNGGKEIK